MNFNPQATQQSSNTPCIYPVGGCKDSMAMNFNPKADYDNGSCVFVSDTIIYGCMDNTALNYNPEATAETPNVPCVYPVYGCKDSLAKNYNPKADYYVDTLCVYPTYGCTDRYAINFNSQADINNGSCTYKKIEEPILGCMEASALNYNPVATISDYNSCVFQVTEQQPIYGCIDPKALNFNPNATDYDSTCVYAEIENTYNEEITNTETLVDTIAAKPIEKCDLTAGLGIDSAIVTNVKFNGGNDILVDWKIVQNGTPIYYYDIAYTFAQEGINLFYLSIICKDGGVQGAKSRFSVQSSAGVTGYSVSATYNIVLASEKIISLRGNAFYQNGSFTTPSNWDEDFDLEYVDTYTVIEDEVESAISIYSISNVTLLAGGEFKLRLDHDWAINWGFSQHGDGDKGITNIIDATNNITIGSDNNLKAIAKYNYASIEFRINWETGECSLMLVDGIPAFGDIEMPFNIWGGNYQGMDGSKLAEYTPQLGDVVTVHLTGTATRDISDFNIVILDNRAIVGFWKEFSTYGNIGNITAGETFDVELQLTINAVDKAGIPLESPKITFMGNNASLAVGGEGTAIYLNLTTYDVTTPTPECWQTARTVRIRSFYGGDAPETIDGSKYLADIEGTLKWIDDADETSLWYEIPVPGSTVKFYLKNFATGNYIYRDNSTQLNDCGDWAWNAALLSPVNGENGYYKFRKVAHPEWEWVTFLANVADADFENATSKGAFVLSAINTLHQECGMPTWQEGVVMGIMPDAYNAYTAIHLNEVEASVQNPDCACIEFTVTFNSDGGSSVGEQFVCNGKTATAAVSVKAKSILEGWYTAGDVEFDFSTPITGNIELFAHWVSECDIKTIRIRSFYAEDENVKVSEEKYLTDNGTALQWTDNEDNTSLWYEIPVASDIYLKNFSTGNYIYREALNSLTSCGDWAWNAALLSAANTQSDYYKFRIVPTIWEDKSYLANVAGADFENVTDGGAFVLSAINTLHNACEMPAWNEAVVMGIVKHDANAFISVYLDETKNPNCVLTNIETLSASPSLYLYMVNGQIYTADSSVKFRVYNLVGQEIANHNLIQGIYIVKAQYGEQTETLKVLVK